MPGVFDWSALPLREKPFSSRRFDFVMLDKVETCFCNHIAFAIGSFVA